MKQGRRLPRWTGTGLQFAAAIETRGIASDGDVLTDDQFGFGGVKLAGGDIDGVAGKDAPAKALTDAPAQNAAIGADDRGADEREQPPARN